MQAVTVPGNIRRLSAHFTDQLILMVFWSPVWIKMAQYFFADGVSEAEIFIEWKWLLLCFFLQFTFRWFFIQYLQATPGKLLFGLRVVPKSDPEKPLLWMQSFLRVLTDHLSVFFGKGLFMLALLRFDRTHVSDWVAETRVVQLMPSIKPARRHLFWGLFLCLYFSVIAFHNAYLILQKSELAKDGVRLVGLFSGHER